MRECGNSLWRNSGYLYVLFKKNLLYCIEKTLPYTPTWWLHDTATLVVCVPVGFPHKEPIIWNLNIFCDVSFIRLLNRRSSLGRLEKLWPSCYVMVRIYCNHKKFLLLLDVLHNVYWFFFFWKSTIHLSYLSVHLNNLCFYKILVDCVRMPWQLKINASQNYDIIAHTQFNNGTVLNWTRLIMDAFCFYKEPDNLLTAK